MMYNNTFYFSYINAIGGVETFFYNLARKYHNLDLVIFYKDGDPAQISRLQEYIRVIKWRDERVKCKKAFFNFNLDTIDYFDAEEYIQVAHGDYKSMGIRPNTSPKITRYLGVSQLVCDTYSEIIGKPVDLVYNPIIVDTPKKVLNLISATRLTKEKGKARMERLAKILEDHHIPYIWTVFTDDKKAIKNENFVYRTPSLNVIDYIANSDYLVQLSDNEGYCYSVAESLCVGTPVIVTNCPVFSEIGVKNGTNGFILDFNLHNVPVDEIYKGLKKFNYIPKEDTWGDIFVPGESSYYKDLERIVNVKALRKYWDIKLNRIVNKDEIIAVNSIRADDLVNNKQLALYLEGDYE